jgi:hypothetical protein
VSSESFCWLLKLFFQSILFCGIPVLRLMFSAKEMYSVLKFHLMNREVFQFIYCQHSICRQYFDQFISTLFSWDKSILIVYFFCFLKVTYCGLSYFSVRGLYNTTVIQYFCLWILIFITVIMSCLWLWYRLTSITTGFCEWWYCVNTSSLVTWFLFYWLLEAVSSHR